MSTLTEIVSLKLKLEELLIESGGEITDEINQLLTISDTELSEKADSYYQVLKACDRERIYWREEASKLQAIAKGYERLEEVLKSRVLEAMRILGLKEVNGRNCRFKIAMAPHALKVDDESLIPPEYQIVKIEYDKSKIKEHLRNLNSVSGCRLEQSEYLRISLNKKDL